jgi:long-subunit acyl-CoA synthetase (AMP-forming)
VLPQFSVRTQDGELLVRGNLMLGYMNEPDSWYPQEFATGDLGLVDTEGFVQVQGRRKNLLISSYGRNIAPEWIESELLATLLFRDAVLVGDSRPWCSALLYPVQPQLGDQQIQQAIDAINARLPDYARVRRWWRLPQPLAVLPGLLTANGRPRREAINAAFHQQIDALYRGAAHAAPNLQQETIA